MDQRPIGVFDSGLGGLTAVREMRRLMPSENIIYFGDTSRVPYEIMGPEVSLVNAGAESVHTLHDALARRQLLAPEGTGQALLCTSDRPEGFGQMARRFLQEEPTAPVRLVDIERY